MTLDKITKNFNNLLKISITKKTIQKTFHKKGFYSKITKKNLIFLN